LHLVQSGFVVAAKTGELYDKSETTKERKQ